MKVEELRLGQRVRIKDTEMGGGTHFAKVDSFTPDMFNGQTLVVVEVLGELKVVHPNALIPLKNKKAK
jgi:hypothetical protein